MEKLEVSREFVVEAHKEACSKWKKKIEDSFPSLFNATKQIESMIEYRAFKNCGGDINVVPEKYIELTLPNCNKDWTFAAWRLAIAICTQYPEWYPYHDLEVSKRNNITLKWQ